MLRDTAGLTDEARRQLRTSLAQGLAHDTRVVVVDGVAAGREAVVDVVATMGKPRWVNEDRDAAARSIERHLGTGAARNFARHGVRLLLKLELRATARDLPVSALLSETADRQLVGTETDITAIVGDLERELVEQAGRPFAALLARDLARIP